MKKQTYQAVLEPTLHEAICKEFGYGLKRGSFSEGVREMYAKTKQLETQLKTLNEKGEKK